MTPFLLIGLPIAIFIIGKEAAQSRSKVVTSPMEGGIINNVCVGLPGAVAKSQSKQKTDQEIFSLRPILT